MTFDRSQTSAVTIHFDENRLPLAPRLRISGAIHLLPLYTYFHVVNTYKCIFTVFIFKCNLQWDNYGTCCDRMWRNAVWQKYRVIQEERLIVWEVLPSVIVIRKSSYEHAFNAEWSHRYSCLNLQIQNRILNCNKEGEITIINVKRPSCQIFIPVVRF
jgi:hypothetical protein